MSGYITKRTNVCHGQSSAHQNHLIFVRVFLATVGELFFWLYACTILFEFEILFKVISIGHYLTAVLGGLGSASSLKILFCRFQN